MSAVAGVEIQAAFKKALVWNTPVAVGANDGILILPTSIKKDAPIESDDSLGTYFSEDGTPGAIKVEGDIPMYLRYDSLDVLLALFMGVAGVPTQQGTTAAYAYTYKWKQDIDGYFGTFVKHMKNYIEEIPSAKIAGITIKGEVGKPLQAIFKVIGVNKVYDSAVNTTTTFNNVTYFEKSNRVRFAQGVFRMNDQSGAALEDGDKIYPSSFELSAVRKLTGVYNGQYSTPGSNKQDLIDEPTNDGHPEISLKLSFPRHSSNARLLDLGSDTRKKMDITFTGALIEGAYYRQFRLQFPHLQLKNVDPVDEQGIIKEPLDLIVHAATSAPAGMTGITDPFWITGINRRATDPLA
ncbi:hypothetical protein A45J_0405 [hot springs metagenome]|uniref:Uncharacterized protein n=1 Tax=hot springs metagenome TaxID=433727 RepID=A0A5J4L1Q1_9ZZZZ